MKTIYRQRDGKKIGNTAQDLAFVRLGKVLYEIALCSSGNGCLEKSEEGGDAKWETDTHQQRYKYALKK